MIKLSTCATSSTVEHATAIDTSWERAITTAKRRPRSHARTHERTNERTNDSRCPRKRASSAATNVEREREREKIHNGEQQSLLRYRVQAQNRQCGERMSRQRTQHGATRTMA